MRRAHQATAYFSLQLILALFHAEVYAFAPPKPKNRPLLNKQLSATVPREELSITEKNRPARRDVFSYDLWVEHRSPDRFVGNLVSVFQSPIVLHLLKDVLNMTFFAASICVYNDLFVIGYDDWSGIRHATVLEGTTLPILQLPSVVFGLTTPFLALLLGRFSCVELKC